ncbi:sigma 54-dependent Fis family transcriptional regulator [Sorangium sp. So ce1036]|uniref:sigma 54-interacting transcriptional regulator n=1 Tax=Sorangium sp. So ce1036 TaxID=3133328 RepID=UPI003F0D58F7
MLQGPDAGASVELPGPEARLGTGRDADLLLKDPTVSRFHLVLRIEGDNIRVLDAGSRNGTTVDGIRVRDAYARPDSAIGLGGTVLRLRMLPDMVELPLSPHDRFGQMLGQSVAMRRLFALLERVAPRDSTLLIEGETGTGKEIVARSVHAASARAHRPFVVFDCSAVSANLIESELFGHLRAAFTGATNDRVGRFEAADGGTLFLDEIGELPLELQPKLLRAIENREIVRIGSNTPRRVDVRIIAATNRCLTREVERGTFREDLYYRLAVVPVRLPPLRERIEDIPLLVRQFEAEWRAHGAAPIPDEVVARLKRQSWPGNVRELRNKIDRMLALGVPELLPDSAADAACPAKLEVNLAVPLAVGLEHIVEEYKRAYVEAALRQAEGNVSRAARIAGVGRAFIQKAMKRFSLSHVPRAPSARTRGAEA